MLSPGSFLDVDVADSAINVNWDGVVRVRDLLELTVNKSFIKIKHQSLPALQVLRLGPKQAPSLISVSLAPEHQILASRIVLPVR